MNETAHKPPPGPWRALFRKLRKNRVAVVGGGLLAILYLCACCAGFLAPYDPADADRNATQAPPMLLGGFTLTSAEVPSAEDPQKKVTVWDRTFSWWDGGVDFEDGQGRFTFRPHVHPIVEKEYEDEHGETSYAKAAEDRSVSVPVEFLVRGEDHEMFSLLGMPGTTIRGPWRLFGAAKPPGAKGTVRVCLFGSDQLGRDVFSRLLFGAQISLSVGIVSILITMTLGMAIGGVAGYFGGWIDLAAMRVTEVVMSVPDLYLIIVVGGLLREVKPGGKALTPGQTYVVIVAVLALVGWAGRARIIRGMVLSLKQKDFVVSARALGLSSSRIIVRHVLPNTLSYAIVSATLAIPGLILAEVALSFLGFGIQEPQASWGNMLHDAQKVDVLSKTPWLVVPGLFIFVTVLAYNFLGDGLRDAADPKAVIVRAMKKGLADAKKGDGRTKG